MFRTLGSTKVLIASSFLIFNLLAGLKAYSQVLPDFEVQAPVLKTFSTKNGGDRFIERNTYPLGSKAKCEATFIVQNNTTVKQKVKVRIEYWPRNRATGAFENSGMAQTGEIELKPNEQLPVSTSFVTGRFGQIALLNPPEIQFKITLRKADDTSLYQEQSMEMEHRGSN